MNGLKISCRVIKDLIFLYKMEKASGSSIKLIMNHLAECESCRNYYIQLESVVDDHQDNKKDPDEQSEKDIGVTENLLNVNHEQGGEEDEDVEEEEEDDEEREDMEEDESDLYDQREHDDDLEDAEEGSYGQRAAQLLAGICFYGIGAGLILSIFSIDESSGIFTVAIVFPFLFLVMGSMGFFVVKKWWHLPVFLIGFGCLWGLTWLSLYPFYYMMYYAVLVIIGWVGAWLGRKIYRKLKEDGDDE